MTAMPPANRAAALEAWQTQMEIEDMHRDMQEQEAAHGRVEAALAELAAAYADRERVMGRAKPVSDRGIHRLLPGECLPW